jgi:hypothetical protein
VVVALAVALVVTVAVWVIVAVALAVASVRGVLRRRAIAVPVAVTWQDAPMESGWPDSRVNAC